MSEPTKPETLDRVLDVALARAVDEPVTFDVAAGKQALALALRQRAAAPVAVKRRRAPWHAAAAAVVVAAGV
ncbi:hypothetical protein FXN61_32160, partial [Lentzea sp. PSKA42]